MVSRAFKDLDLLLENKVAHCTVLGFFNILPVFICCYLLYISVYPSLESDEEDHVSKAKMKRKKNWEDTPWSPKGKGLDITSNHRIFACQFL